ncbi:hypothetical protein [Streptomyces sp. NPDC048002]|uniref:hypothetical protein n=1 Tax=Streptomyces sp. NPDC048002 TaxID=3154344 RepID=UPI0033D8C613
MAVVVLMLASGCMWQPQALARAEIVGTWAEGGTGTVLFKDDGTVVVTGLAEFNDEGDKVSECSGTGEWGVYPDGEEAEQVSVTVCDGNPWEFGGSKEHPEMRRLVADPSYGKYQTLSRR